VSILQSLVGDPVSAAIAVGQLKGEDDRRAFQVYEVRKGFQKALARGYIGPEHILPEFNNAVSAVVAALLDATAPVATSTVADQADITTQAMNYDPNQVQFDALEAVGLLERNDQGCGKATLWRLRLPFKSERRAADRPTPTVDATISPEACPERRLTDAVANTLFRFLDDVCAAYDRQIFGTDEDLSAFAGHPFERDLGPLLRAHPDLEPLVELVASLLDEDVAQVVDDQHWQRTTTVVDLGEDPSPETAQASLQTVAGGD